MTHEELEEAVPLYAAGALERTERQALEAHLLSGCVSCHTALKEFQSVAAILPFGLSSTPPPRTLKAKIMAARTPAAIIDRLSADLNNVLARPDVRERFAALGLDAQPGTVAEFSAYVDREVAKWSKIVRSTGITVE